MSLVRRHVLFTLLVAPLLGQDDFPEGDRRAALEAATELLDLIDRGDFEAAWDRASPHAREKGDRASFVRQMPDVQRRLGAKVSREAQSTEFKTELPELPEGQYALFRFTSEFAEVGVVDEALSLQRLGDGEWGLLGYFVRPRR